MFKILSRKLFGKNFSRLLTSLLISAIIYIGLCQIGYNISVSSQVLSFINLFFSGTLMLQFLASENNAKYLKGFFAMPFNKKRFIMEYAAVMGLHVFVTKTLLVYSIIFAFAEIRLVEAVILFSSFIFICFSAMLAFAFFKKTKILSLLVFIIAFAMCFMLPESPITAIIYQITSVIYAIALLFVNPYKFMITSSFKRKSKSYKKVKGSNLLVAKYIFRHITSNKSYLINPSAMLAFASFIVYQFNSMGFNDGIVIALALITFNTPLAIIVSSNKSLHKKLNSTPNTIKNFYLPYGFVVFAFNIIFSALLIIISFLLGSQINIKTIIAAAIFPIQNRIIVLLEYNYPILNWHVETDLWHNPRKYIIPLTLIFEAAIFTII